jgi:hypothetical protein
MNEPEAERTTAPRLVSIPPASARPPCALACRGWRRWPAPPSGCSTSRRRAASLNRLAERLAGKGAQVLRFQKPTFTKPAPVDLRQEIATRCDAVIEALAD